MFTLLVLVYLVTPNKGCGLNDNCCKCPPGARLGDSGTCEDPQCTPCENDEYMPSYNRERICRLQPYCDPNLNFEIRHYYDLTKRHTCRCKKGFHCSNSDFCLLCIPHSTCEKDYVAISLGNHTHDVECGPRPDRPSTFNPMLLLCGIPVLAVVVGMVVICTKQVPVQCPDVLNVFRCLYNFLTIRTEGMVTDVNGTEGLELEGVVTDVNDTEGLELEGVTHTKSYISNGEQQGQQQGPRIMRCICKLPKTVCLIMVITLPLGLSCALITVVDWCLAAYCDASVSIYTFPLGHSITSHGLGQIEAIPLSTFLNRCKNQNEFTVPGTVRFHKAIKCVRTTKYHKQGNSGTYSRKNNTGSKDSISVHAGASGSFVGVTASAEASFSKIDAVENTVESSVSNSDNVAISLTSYKCEVGTVMFSSYTPSSALKQDIHTLNQDPYKTIDDFLHNWGYAFVSSTTVGGYYSSFNIFSTCNKDAMTSLDFATEHCNEFGAKAEATGGVFGASVGVEKVKCNTEGLSDSQRQTLTDITKESQTLQVGGDTLGGEANWELTLKMNPYPLQMTITPITTIVGFSEESVTLIKSRAANVQLSVASLMEKVPDMTRQC